MTPSHAAHYIIYPHTLTINDEHGCIRDGRPQLVGGVANIFALVLLQGIHGITERVECR